MRNRDITPLVLNGSLDYLYEKSFSSKEGLIFTCHCGEYKTWGERGEGVKARDLIMHWSSCICALKEMENKHPDIYNHYKKTFLSGKKKSKKLDELYINSHSCPNLKSTSPSKCTSFSEEYVNDFFVTSKIVASTNDFPSLPGVYMIRYFIDKKWEILYIGISKNLQNRWINHHRQKEIDFMLCLGIKIEYRYLCESIFMKFAKPIEVIERELIAHFNPILNRANLTKFGNLHYD